MTASTLKFIGDRKNDLSKSKGSHSSVPYNTLAADDPFDLGRENSELARQSADFGRTKTLPLDRQVVRKRSGSLDADNSPNLVMDVSDRNW